MPLIEFKVILLRRNKNCTKDFDGFTQGLVLIQCAFISKKTQTRVAYVRADLTCDQTILVRIQQTRKISDSHVMKMPFTILYQEKVNYLDVCVMPLRLVHQIEARMFEDIFIFIVWDMVERTWRCVLDDIDAELRILPFKVGDIDYLPRHVLVLVLELCEILFVHCRPIALTMAPLAIAASKNGRKIASA